MTFDRLTRATLSLRSYQRKSLVPYGRARGCIFALALCLFILVSAGCAQESTALTGPSKATTSRQQSVKQITYVAIGASDTFGIGTYDPYDDNWPTDLAALLGPSHIHLINLGIPDITIHDALNLELPVALDSHADLITIWLGVNDIVAKVPTNSYASDLNALLSRLRANSPHARIAIANIPDLTLLPFFAQADPQVLTRQIQAYNTVIASAAQQYQAILVDLTQQNYNLRTHPEYIYSDGLHLTDTGYQQLANVFYQALQHH
jgi:lysophospholipase L1-like esterase